MKKFWPIIIFLVLFVLFLGLGISRRGTSARPAGQEKSAPQIAVIPKVAGDPFWNAVRAGAKQAARETNAEIIWNGPERENDREKQMQILEDFIVQKVDAVVLAPLDNAVLAPLVQKVADAHIPCVLIDSVVAGDSYVSFIAADNYQSGVLAARRMGEMLQGQGRVALIPYQAGSGERENGFMDTLKKEFPGISFFENKYSGETGLQAVQDILTRHPALDGIFACSEAAARAVLSVLENQGRSGKVKMIACDASESLLADLRAGLIDALVVQNPYALGYESVKTALAALAGQEIPRKIDLGVKLITADNLDTPEIEQFLNPPQ